MNLEKIKKTRLWLWSIYALMTVAGSVVSFIFLSKTQAFTKDFNNVDWSALSGQTVMSNNLDNINNNTFITRIVILVLEVLILSRMLFNITSKSPKAAGRKTLIWICLVLSFIGMLAPLWVLVKNQDLETIMSNIKKDFGTVVADKINELTKKHLSPWTSTSVAYISLGTSLLSIVLMILQLFQVKKIRRISYENDVKQLALEASKHKLSNSEIEQKANDIEDDVFQL